MAWRLAAAALFASCGLGARAARWRSRDFRLSGAVVLLGSGDAATAGLLDRLHFDDLDENRDGVVDRVELMVGARDLLDFTGEAGRDFRARIYDDLKALYSLSDIDGDGVLSAVEVEFARLLGRAQTSDDVAGARALHSELDTDRDGSVDRAEFEDFVRSMMHGTDVSAFSGRVFAKADVTGDGRLSPPESHFAALLAVEMSLSDAARAMFEDFDTNADGRISRQEVAERLAALRHTGSRHVELMDRLTRAFDGADTDTDGYLDEHEARVLIDELLFDERHVH